MLKRNLIANYFGQGWAALMGFIFIPLYIKYLGVEAYGLIGLFAVLQAWLTLLDIGMTPTLNREMARFTAGVHSATSIRDLLRSVEIISLGIAALVGLGIWAASGWLASDWLCAEKLSVGIVAQGFVIMGAVTALRFVEGVYRSAIVGLQRQVLFNGVSSAMATLRGLGAVGVLVWVSPTLEAFFLWQGVVSIATLVILGATTYANLPKGERGGRFSLEALRGVWRFAGGVAGITFLALLLTQIDKMLLSNLLTLTEFGYYTLAGTVAGALYMLIAPATQALYPKLCELHARGDTVALADSYHKGAQLVSVMAGSAAIVLIFFAETFLRLWTQDAELSGRMPVLLSVLTLGNLLNGLMWVPYQTQLAHGWTSLTVKVNIVAVALIAPGILWAVPRYGAVGAAWVWVALNAGYCVIAAQFMYRRIMPAEKWRWYWQDVLMPLLAASLAVGAIKYLWPVQDTASAQAAALVIAAIASLTASGLASGRARQQALLVIKPLLTKFSVKPIFSVIRK